MGPVDPQALDAIDDAFAEAVRILVLGEAYCDGLPWSALDANERSEWLPRGRRYRERLEARGLIVTAMDDRH